MAALGLSCNMGDLIPWPGNEPGSPELGVIGPPGKSPSYFLNENTKPQKIVDVPSPTVAEPGWDAQAACHPSLGWRVPGSQSPREWETTALLTPGNLTKGPSGNTWWSDMTTPSTPNSSLAGLPFFLFPSSHQTSCMGIRRATNAQGNLPWGTDGVGVGSQNC